MSGTEITTPEGPVKAQSLAAGDWVIDEDGAPVRVLDTAVISCTRDAMLQDRTLAPIRFEPAEDDLVEVTQAVLLAPDLPVQAMEDGAISVPAHALENGHSIRRVVPHEGIDYVRLTLARPATLAIAGLRIRFGATADAPRLVASALTPRPEAPLVFRPLT
jgi:hypothetical protein